MSDPVEKALKFLPHVVGKVATQRPIPHSWGRLYKRERVRILIETVGRDDAIQELGSIIVDYYSDERKAKLQEWVDNAPPDNRDALGPSLTVTAINAALSAKRWKPPLTDHEDIDQEGAEAAGRNAEESAALAALAKNQTAGIDLAVVSEPFRDITRGMDVATALWDDDSPVGTAFARMDSEHRRALSAFLEHPNDWGLIADILGVTAKAPHKRKETVKRRVNTAVGQASELLGQATEEALEASGVVLYEDTPGKKDGWRNVKCAFHEDNRRKNAGWHRGWVVYKCWVESCDAYGTHTVSDLREKGLI